MGGKNLGYWAEVREPDASITSKPQFLQVEIGINTSTY